MVDCMGWCVGYLMKGVHCVWLGCWAGLCWAVLVRCWRCQTGVEMGIMQSYFPMALWLVIEMVMVYATPNRTFQDLDKIDLY